MAGLYQILDRAGAARHSWGMDSSAVPRFDRSFFESEHAISRIGSGALGGKAAGLVLVQERILSRLGAQESPYITVRIPTMAVLTTEVFDAFMQRNDLYPTALSDRPDDRIAHAFQRADLPAEFVGDLRALIASVHTPLAVRSSSMLEDDLDHPFAGVYTTKMIPNNEIETDARFRRLEQAIKLVYASTFFREARSYLSSVGQEIRDEKMAVVIQEVVGERHGHRFYPTISGVARSYNYYPTGHGRPEDGVVNLALGLGKTIVDGGLSWAFSPAFPKAPPPFNNIGDLLKNTQTRFWAVSMAPPPVPDPIRETECLVEAGLAEAEADGTLKFLASTYDAASDRLNPGLGGRGARALTFAPLLGSRLLPFTDLLRRLLQLAEEAVGCDVEVELAYTHDCKDGVPARLGFLQVRPMKVSTGSYELSPEDLAAPGVIVASQHVLGNGCREDIRDIVYLKPEVFDPTATRHMAQELDGLNRDLVAAGRHYLLIGFGRWGSSDDLNGVPIVWGQISNARVIVEATLPQMSPDLSQGSHFFHNLLSFQILYLSVKHGAAQQIDWQWLSEQPVVREERHVRHVRCAAPLAITVDGRSGRGVVRQHGTA